MKKYSKRTLLITRIIMFAIGAALGYVAMHGILSAYPQSVATAFGYVYCAGTGLLVGLILLLSAHSALWLIFTVGGGVKNLFAGKRAASVAGVFIGLGVGGMLTYLFDFLISLKINIISLRVILDAVFCVVAVGVAVFLSLKALSRPSQYEEDSAFEDEKTAGYYGGYLLYSSALKCGGIEKFCREWLIGGAAVLDVTVGRLIEDGDETALKVYNALLDGGAAYTVAVGKGDEKEQAVRYAEKHGLRIIAASSRDLGDCSLPVLGFNDLCEKN